MYKMFTLVADRPLYLRIRRNMTKRAAEELYGCPAAFGAAGQIIPLTARPCNVFIAGVGDDFASIARATGADENELEALNGGTVYPTRRIFWLSKSGDNS